MAAPITPALFAWFDFSPTPLRVWSGYGDFVFESQTWLGVGSLGQIEIGEDNIDIDANGASFILNGTPTELLAIALAQPYKGRRVTLHLVLLDPSTFAVLESRVQFVGLMDDLKVEADLRPDGPGSRVVILAEHYLIRKETPVGGRYSDVDQTHRHPGDRIFADLHRLPQARFTWGKS